MINMERFDVWLSAYGKCWESGDSKGITELFTDNAHYFETPFDEPMVGIKAIEQYWREGAAQAQKEVTFNFSAVAVTETKGLSHWSASFVRVPSGVQVELDGFLEAEFATDGRCSSFREWWHRKEIA